MDFYTRLAVIKALSECVDELHTMADRMKDEDERSIRSSAVGEAIDVLENKINETRDK